MRPRTTAIEPLLGLRWLARMASPRSITKRTPSAKSKAPLAVRALNSPKLCPGVADGINAYPLYGIEDHHGHEVGGQLGIMCFL